MPDWIGYRWLAAHYNIQTVAPLRISSQIAGRRSTRTVNGLTVETFPVAYRPAETPAGHLGFALRWEGINLEFLARLFAVMPEKHLCEWIGAEPTGQYARRACFLHEWLTGRQLDHPGVTAGNYTDVLNAGDYLVRQHPRNVRRWRVRDNLPGTPDFCPTILRTDALRAVEALDCAALISALEQEFGTELILRSAVWLSHKESRASFAIEREQDQDDRIKRFAAVMATRCGQMPDPLQPETLVELQKDILGPNALRYGIRRSPVFVGEVIHFGEVVHYIAPHWDQLCALLKGLSAFDVMTCGASPVIRAAVLSFGFVYIHPMPDGNGRISRFLINDVLRRDGALHAPVILPVSATITSSMAERQGYDNALERFSGPLLVQYASQYAFGAASVYEDGVTSNFRFGAYADALAAWRYPDLTDQAIWLGEIIRKTIAVELREEAALLRSHHAARTRIKNEVVDGPNNDIDTIIRSVLQNNRSISGRLRKTYPSVTEEKWQQVVAILNDCFIPPVP